MSEVAPLPAVECVFFFKKKVSVGVRVDALGVDPAGRRTLRELASALSAGCCRFFPRGFARP